MPSFPESSRPEKEEWEEYLDQTRNHEAILRDVFEAFSLDPSKETPGRQVVRKIGETLVAAMHLKLLGLPAVLPPPEEEKDVKTAIGAARAKQARKEML